MRTFVISMVEETLLLDLTHVTKISTTKHLAPGNCIHRELHTQTRTPVPDILYSQFSWQPLSYARGASKYAVNMLLLHFEPLRLASVNESIRGLLILNILDLIALNRKTIEGIKSTLFINFQMANDGSDFGQRRQPVVPVRRAFCSSAHIFEGSIEFVVMSHQQKNGSVQEADQQQPDDMQPPSDEIKDRQAVVVVPNVREPTPAADDEDGDEEPLVLDPETLELDLNHRRMRKIQDLEPLTKLERLCLRWNLIKKIENLNTLTTLVELEFYDNQITCIENLDCLVNLEILDLSFNRISEIKGLDKLLGLKKLYLNSNKISNIKNIDHLTNLELLELGDNRIREIKNLDGLVNLKQLFLGKNKIEKIQNLDKLVNLDCLSLQNNRLIKIENLDKLIKLDQLYLSENQITVIENLSKNTLVTTLDLALNKIAKINNVSHMEILEEFWINDNLISDWSSIDYLKNNKKIATVYLNKNPIADDPAYRRKLKIMIPSLTQIDATLCK
ncbi:uncharacterized protein LOC143915901 [Arctopsyche grandis]|uniref:uncharacterized protein LOC143915901 n=1 Tax=Arctopsyche grandis TaxID=121162 RepID=UPI00406D95D6